MVHYGSGDLNMTNKLASFMSTCQWYQECNKKHYGLGDLNMTNKLASFKTNLQANCEPPFQFDK